MTVPPSLLIDLVKLETPHVGVGEVCRRFSDELAQRLAVEAVPSLRVDGLVPRNFEGTLPAPLRLRPVGLLDRYTGTSGGHDLWHALHQDSAFQPASSQTRLVLTIHDLNFLYEKEGLKAGRRLRRLQQKVDRASAVATISRFTAGEIERHLDLRGRPVSVIPNGIPDVSSTPAVRPAWFPEGRPFLFTICHLTPKKNVHVLLDLASRMTDFLFVLAGNRKTPYGESLVSRAAAERMSNVLLPGEVSDGEKHWLHQHAAAFLFPSLFEGFGLPVAEAMSYGKPVFTSRATALPEVAGDAGFFFDTFEPAEMVLTLRAGLEAFRSDPGAAGRARAQARRFRWESNVEGYLGLYRQVLSGPPRVSGLIG